MLQHAQLLVLRLLQVLHRILQLLHLRLQLHHFLVHGMGRGSRAQQYEKENSRKRNHNLAHKTIPRRAQEALLFIIN